MSLPGVTYGNKVLPNQSIASPPNTSFYALAGSSGPGSNVSSFTASTITLNANINDLTGNNPNPPNLNFNLGNVSTTVFYPLYDTVPSSGKPVSALVTNTNNTLDQGSFYERPQGLATGSLYLYNENSVIGASPVVLSGSNGVLSINGTPYNGGGGVSTFATASISSLTVSSINGAVPGGGSISSFTTASISSLNVSSVQMPVVINPGFGFLAAEFLDIQQVSGYLYSPQQFQITIPSMPIFQLSQTRTGLGGATLGGDVGMGGIYLFGGTSSFTKNSFITHNSTTSGLVIANATTGVNISSPALTLNSNTVIGYGTTSTITFAQLISSVQGHS